MNSRDFLRAKTEGRRLSMVTCYDYTFARLLSNSAIDGILVGDSAAMVMHGHRSTLSATVDLMRLHTEAVARGAAGKFIVADMPFLSFRKGLAAALDAAHALMTCRRPCRQTRGCRRARGCDSTDWSRAGFR